MITNQLDHIHDAVRDYMPGLFPRLAMNYFLPLAAAMFVAVIVVSFMAQWLPPSTANILGFVINLAILVYGWRYLENRNHATALLVMYSTYSRQRRDVLQLLQADDEQQATARLAGVEAAAEVFIDAAQEQQIVPVSEKKR